MDNYYTRINNIKDEIKKLTEEIEFLVKKKENGKISDNEKLKITEYHNKIVDDICKNKNELVEVKN